MAILRRTFLAALAAGGFGATRAAKSYAATLQEAHLDRLPPAGGSPRQSWISPPNAYFTYTSNNGFAPHSGNPIIAQRGGQDVTFGEWNFRQGQFRPILRSAIQDTFFDVGADTNNLFIIQGRQKIVSAPIAATLSNTPPQVHYTSPARTDDLLSVSKSGKTLLFAIRESTGPIKKGTGYELDIASGKATMLYQMPFDADHQQYCPHDESWIGFAHEGDIHNSLDRVWGMHRSATRMEPIRLWDERAAGQGVLFAGHERWCFDRTGALVVAFPESPGRPRGLYFVDAIARNASLVSASDYDWHCNITHDGKWAVVDTKPPPGMEKDDQGRIISDIVLINMASGNRHWVARSHTAVNHPFHPHPHFSPDGNFIIYNDYEHDGRGRDSRTVITDISDLV